MIVQLLLFEPCWHAIYTDAKRELQLRLQQDEVSLTTASAVQSGVKNIHPIYTHILTHWIELKAVIEALQANEHVLQGRYEAAEIERAKAVSSEQQGQ